jgi:hypothetical protein
MPQVIVNARLALDVITRKAYIESRHQERWFPKEPSGNLGGRSPRCLEPKEATARCGGKAKVPQQKFSSDRLIIGRLFFCSFLVPGDGQCSEIT